jgi:hypothetical protein
MGVQRSSWWIVAGLLVLSSVADGMEPPEWTRSVDASRYLLTEAERPQREAVAGEVRVDEPAHWSFAEQDGRNPTGRVSWGVWIHQKLTKPGDPDTYAHVSILVFESPLDAGLQWRMVHRRKLGETSLDAVEDFYQNGPGPARDGNSQLVGNLWVSVGGNWKKYRDAYAAALLAKLDRPQRVRRIEVTAYDGSDHRHLPLTFWVDVTEDGTPLSGEPVRLEVVGEARCLADRWAFWNSSTSQWTEVEDFNLALNAIDGRDAPRTDADGRVIVRLFLDFGRIRMLNVPLPQRIGVRASVDNGNPADTERITGGAAMVARHGAFVRALYYSPPDGPLVPVAVLEAARSRTLDGGASWQERWTRPAGQEVVRREGVRDRVAIGRGERLPEEVVFERPDFYVGFPSPEARLLVDARPDDEPRSRSYLPTGSGIGVHVLWLDGTEGIFMVHAPGVLDAMISGVPNRSMTSGRQALSHVVRFLVGQGTDLLVKTAVVGTATTLGGPVAGGYAFVIAESVMTTNDIIESHGGYLPDNAHLVILRSEIAVTSDENGRPVLHVFEGSPGVVGADGTETVVTDGQALDLLPEGGVGTVRSAAPGAAALAMRDALQMMGPPLPDAVQAMRPPVRGGPETASDHAATPGDAARRWSRDARFGVPALVWIALLVGAVVLCVVGAGVAMWWLRRTVRSGSRTAPEAVTSVPARPPAPVVASQPPVPAPASHFEAAPQPVPAPPPLPGVPEPAEATLIEASGVRHGVVGRCTTLGSAADNDIVIASRGVSRHHARIFCEADGRLWIEDLASTNGVWLDGQRVEKSWLEDGGELVLGTWHARFGARA